MSETKPLVEPRTLKGFQDLLPEDVPAREYVIGKVRGVMEKYGFAAVETPAFEYLDGLLGTGGEETNKELFRMESPEGEPIALRFDQTVPFARLLAQYPDKLKVPFRRYSVGPVWRADKPGPGRFREFVQFDVDIAGSESVAVDAEVVAIMSDIMLALGVERHAVLVNNRKLIDALLDGCGISEASRQKHVLRVVDKLAKVGVDNVRLELGPGRIDDSGDPIPGVKLDAETIDQVVAFVGVKGETREAVLAALAARLPESEAAAAALEETRELVEGLAALGVSEEHAQLAPSLTRGLDYYTGPVFETVLPDAPEFGSVMGGGRYDGLVARFAEREVPCTGMAVGLDRLLAALKRLEVALPARPIAEVLIVTLGNVGVRDAFAAARELREAGIRTQTYSGAKKSMKRQLSHADHYGIPVAVILGEDEVAKGVVSVKDLQAGKRQREHIEDHEQYRKAGKTAQVTVPRAEMVKTVKALLD